MTNQKLSVLFICLGNICRSPLAEALFRKEVTDEGLEHLFEIDSAGTSGYHDGEGPDPRTTSTAAARGVEVSGVSRRVVGEDVRRFDYLVAMDASNREEVERLVEAEGGDARVYLLREFDPDSPDDAGVPDPYFGGPTGFEDVHDIVERAARGLLEHIRREHGV